MAVQIIHPVMDEVTTTDHRKKTRRDIFPYEMGYEKPVKFFAGSPKLTELCDGVYVGTGEVITAQGHRFYAVIDSDVDNFGQASAVRIAVKKGKAETQYLDLMNTKERERAEVILSTKSRPVFLDIYAYSYYLNGRFETIAVDEETFWSASWVELMEQSGHTVTNHAA